MKNQSIIEELIHISKEKKVLMQSIFEVTSRQKEFLNLDKIQTVVKQINLKDKYIVEVDKLDIKFYNTLNKLKTSLEIESLEEIDAAKYPQMKELKKVVGEILKLTKDIQAINNENINVLNKDMGEISKKLKGLRQGKKATNAYGAYKNQVTSVFLDKKK